jgi:hypothetical protein
MPCNRRTRPLGLGGVLADVVLLGAACGGGATGSTGSSLQIVSPANGPPCPSRSRSSSRPACPSGTPAPGTITSPCASMAPAATASTRWGTAAPSPSKGCPPGEHTIVASLRNADHSAGGTTDTITVTVAAASVDSASPAPTPGAAYGGY